MCLPFSNFSPMVLFYYNRALSQYTSHFYIPLSILEYINNTVGHGPLSLSDIQEYFHIKPIGSYYMISERENKKKVCFFPNKIKYKYYACYDVRGNYQGHLELNIFKPNFERMPSIFTLH